MAAPGPIFQALFFLVPMQSSNMPIANAVTAVPAADSATALAHFRAALQFETDCSDVSSALASATPGFVLLDVRSPALFAQGHVPGAHNLPHGKSWNRNW